MRTDSYLKTIYNLRAIAYRLLLSAALLTLAVGCEKDRSLETDAELGLSFQQATGRRVFETYCTMCHYAYSSSGLKGPGLKNLFGRSSLPSGLPASDPFVEQTIISGRGMMPAQGSTLTEQQLRDLMAYLHTL